MQSRILTQSSILARIRIAAMLFLGIFSAVGFVGSAWAQYKGGVSWQVGDIIVCFGNGMCNVLRIVNVNGVPTPQLLDQISDGLTGAGATNGAAINNTLHVLATDATIDPNTHNPAASKIVEYTIASVNPLQTQPLAPPLLPISHTPVTVFNGGSGNFNVRAIALDQHGDMFVGNANNPPANPATIVELDPNGGSLGSFTVPTVTTPAWLAMTCFPGTPTCQTGPSPNIMKILDENGHVQQVLTPGTSASTHPLWNDAGGTTRDNAVIWTDQGKSVWQASTTYPLPVVNPPTPLSIYIVDTFNPPHLQKATFLPGNTSGTTGPTGPPQFSDTPFGGGVTTDGLIWTDQGAAAVWAAGTMYGGAGQPQFVRDTNIPPHVQQATNPGTSGGTAPTWNDGTAPGGMTCDNGTLLACAGIIWVDRGLAAYQPNHRYNVTDAFLDSGMHVQQASAAGTAGSAPPTFTHTGTSTQTPDNVILWVDQGPWLPSHSYAVGSVVGDAGQHVQQVLAGGAGISGPGPNPPSFVDGLNPGVATTTDGLQWSDLGLPTLGAANCPGNQINSLDLFPAASPTAYFTSGPGGIIQTVTTPLSSGACAVFADFGPFVKLSGIRAMPPKSVPNCKSDPVMMNSCPIYPNGGILVVATGTQDIDTGDTTDPDAAVEQVTDICTGNSTNVALGGDTGNTCALLLDLNGKIRVRYTLSQSVSTLQALALDPFIADCTSIGCSTSGSIPSATVANFWVGDKASSKFYSFDFATGAPTPYDASQTCPTQAIPPTATLPSCNSGQISSVNGVQSIAIYGARGAAQPVLAKLYGAPTSPEPTSNAEVFFLQNKLITTIYNTSAHQVQYPLTLWASLVDNNSDVAGLPSDTSTDGGVPCQPTTLSGPNTVDRNDCIVWKFDVALNNTAGDFVSTVFGAPVTTSPAPPTIDTNTHIFTDMKYDTTTLFGNFDPSDSRISVHSLHQVTPQPLSNGSTSGGQCTYGSPVPKCFQNNSNIQFKFTCADPSLAGSALGNLSPPPFLLIDQTFPNVTFASPLECGRTNTCTFSATNGSENYTFDSVKNQWVFGWSVPPPPIPNTTRYFTGCTTQPQLSPFCVSFFVSPKCSANPVVNLVSPSSGSVSSQTPPVITITGADFASNATVQFQGVTVSATVLSSTQITLTLPSCSLLNIGPCPRQVNVTVTNPLAGLNGTLVNGFTYTQ